MMPPLTIGKVAKRAGVRIDTVRFYERQGLLASPPRGNAGYRHYPEDTVARIRFIRRAKSLGFSLQEVRELLALRLDAEGSRGEVKIRVETKLAAIVAKIRALQHMQEALMAMTAACDGCGPVDDCPILGALAEEESMMRTTWKVQGMHCERCVQRIKGALQRFPAITQIEVDQGRAMVCIEHYELDLDTVAMAIASLGFQVSLE